MQQLPFILVTIGIICIIISFLLPDKEKRERQKKGEQLTPEEKANLIAQGKKEIDGIFNDKTEDVIEKVDEQLSRISNEKIISVSEYSDQVLEKISQNHQEVVFLYNMLNEKEEEMKKLMTKMKPVSKEDTPGKKQEEHLAKRARELELSEETKETVLDTQKNFQDNEDMDMLRELIYDDGTQRRKEEQKRAEENQEKAQEGLSGQVIEMYQNGMSILEISKQLHKGQGEVRLIVDLYAKR